MTALLIGSEELTERWNGRKSATVVFAVSLVVLAAAALGGTLIPETAYQPSFGRTNLPPGAGEVIPLLIRLYDKRNQRANPHTT